MSRNIKDLHPDLQVLAALLVKKCNANGLKIGIGECFRTVLEQNSIYAQGRTKPGIIVTNCKGDSYLSMHQWGIAFDFYRNDGKGAYYDKDGFFTKVGKIGQSIGLEWGGSWTSIIDKPHFQLPDWGSSSKILRVKYANPSEFKKTWINSKKRINKMARPERVKLFQEKLNSFDVGLPKLVVDGDYGNKTRIYLLMVWKKWGWNKNGKDTGLVAGSKTLKKLNMI